MGASIVIGLNVSNSRATTSTEPFARNTHHRSDIGRDRREPEGWVRSPASGRGAARASSDDLVAGGVELIGVDALSRSVRVQQNDELVRPRTLTPTTAGEGIAKVSGEPSAEDDQCPADAGRSPISKIDAPMTAAGFACEWGLEPELFGG
jgi:hypothetical protein